MIYADYTYYQDTYRGNAIAEADFPRLAQRASERVDHATRFRAAGYVADDAHDPAPLSNATCAIAEILQQAERGNALTGEGSENAPIQSETTGKHHVVYAAPMNTASQEGQRAIDKAAQAAARLHLMPTGLLYRGVGRC